MVVVTDFELSPLVSMMSLHEALRVQRQPDSKTQELNYDYKANVSEAWCIGGIPQGGYAVGIVLAATNDLQSRSSHPDPMHLTAHFLQPVDVSECSVHIRLIRRGKNLTNLDADLLQNGKTKISTRIIYGVISDLTEVHPTPPDNLTLTPPSPHARRTPFLRHPSLARPDKPNDKYLYQVKAEDRFFEEKNAARANQQASGSLASSDCGLEWGSWLELKDPADVLETAMIPFLADCMKNLPSLLPRELRPGPSWFATVVLTVEFKSRIPTAISRPSLSGPKFAPRTVGIYSSARFMSEGRHDEYVEIWTAPSPIGDSSSSSSTVGPDENDPGWREKQVCLAIATQMALTIPEENSRRSKARL